MEEQSRETSTSRRAWRRRLGALALGLLLLIGVGEVGARLFEHLVPMPTRRPPLDSPLPELKTIGDIARRNQVGIWKGRYYRTNSAGFRGPEWSREPAPGTLRILVTGDSITLGAGVDEKETYAYRLQARLQEDPALPPVEVLNVGLGGLNARAAVLRLQTAVALYSADIVVYGFNLNDIEGPHYADLTDPAEMEERRKRHQRFDRSPSRLLATAYPPVAEWIDRKLFGAISPIDEWHHNYFDNEAAWADLDRSIGLFARLARRADACALMLVLTKLGDLGPTHPYRSIYARAAEAAEAHGVFVQETLPYFAWRRPEPYWVARYDPHPNADGHALLAEALEDGLRALPPECWQPSH